ncbi:MAG: hypothetical protein KME64_24720 [Scytonematopsis contorta HA4267-MV1]|jgi:hypothetical protein|nr:hypothetical protein [Scytonematopsis contorta HA4267-MV1]
MTIEVEKITNIEELVAWQEELYELEKYAVSGKPIPEVQQEQIINNLLDKNYEARLVKLRQRKEELIKTLAIIEQREKRLVEKVNRLH